MQTSGLNCSRWRNRSSTIDYPMIPLYDRVTINSVSSRVHGVNPINFGSVTGLVWNTHEWSID